MFFVSFINFFHIPFLQGFVWSFLYHSVLLFFHLSYLWKVHFLCLWFDFLSQWQILRFLSPHPIVFTYLKTFTNIFFFLVWLHFSMTSFSSLSFSFFQCNKFILWPVLKKYQNIYQYSFLRLTPFLNHIFHFSLSHFFLSAINLYFY